MQFVVDQPATIGALPIAVALAEKVLEGYPSGLAMRRIAGRTDSPACVALDPACRRTSRVTLYALRLRRRYCWPGHQQSDPRPLTQIRPDLGQAVGDHDLTTPRCPTPAPGFPENSRHAPAVTVWSSSRPECADASPTKSARRSANRPWSKSALREWNATGPNEPVCAVRTSGRPANNIDSSAQVLHYGDCILILMKKVH